MPCTWTVDVVRCEMISTEVELIPTSVTIHVAVADRRSMTKMVDLLLLLLLLLRTRKMLWEPVIGNIVRFGHSQLTSIVPLL